MSCQPYEAHVTYLVDDKESTIKDVATSIGFQWGYVSDFPGLGSTKLLYCIKTSCSYDELETAIAVLINSIDTPPIRYKTLVVVKDLEPDKETEINEEPTGSNG